MKILALWGGILLSPLLLMAAPSHDLEVKITGLRSQDGTVQVGLYDRAETFPKPEEMRANLTIEAGALEDTPIMFRDLPPGDYAVAVYHDENHNHQFDQGFLGWPLEGFGFSRNVKPFWQAPAFDEAVFQIDGQDTVIEIEMLYWHEESQEESSQPHRSLWR